MKNRLIPGTTLNVSELAFGNFIYGSHMWGKTPEDQPEGIRLQNLAFDLGVNFFDTGDAYGNGRAEAMMKPTLAYAGRDKIILSTKFGYDFYTDPGAPGSHKERKQDFSGKFIRFALEESLKRMGTDFVDLYQAHNVKLPQMKDEMRATLDALVKEGKIRYWGIALGPAIGWREEGVASFEQWPLKKDGTGCAVVQSVYNMLEQHPGRELCEVAAKAGVGGVISRVPHSSGILQDIYTADMKFTDHRAFRDKNWLIYGLKKVEALRHIQKAHNCTMGQLAIKWLLTWPTCVSVQPNIVTEQDLREFAAACDGDRLTAAEMKEVENMVESDFGFGPDAHACDLKSSVSETGTTKSHYQSGQRVPMVTA
jgi:aryl-alcohol dehydrogenase-like predicted oxidoreductase